MLTGIQAFEARWIDLIRHHPTTKDDNTVIAHAMGQLIDRYETPADIEQELPNHLKALFRELAIAFFRGYQPSIEMTVVASTPATTHRIAASTQDAGIAIAVDRVRALARDSSCSLNPRQARCRVDDPSEAETLIIEFPEGWPHPS